MNSDILYKRIGPAAHSPRACQQFPYRPRAGFECIDVPAIRDEIGRFLADNMRLLQKIVSRRAHYLKAHDREDMLSDLLVTVSQVLPKFDSLRAVRLTTFVWRCSFNACSGLLRKIRADRNRLMLSLETEEHIQGPNLSIDRRIEHLAENIVSGRTKGLTKRQTQWLMDYHAFPNDGEAIRSERLGLAQASSGSMIKARICERLKDLAEELA